MHKEIRNMNIIHAVIGIIFTVIILVSAIFLPLHDVHNSVGFV